MFTHSQKGPKVLAALAMSMFLVAGIFGISHAMNMDSNGQMSGCPFMGVATVCNMSPLEHVAAWQSMFTSTSSENTLSLLLSVLLVAVSILFVLSEGIFPKIRPPLLCRPHRFSLFRHSLQEAFSNGILNSKAY